MLSEERPMVRLPKLLPHLERGVNFFCLNERNCPRHNLILQNVRNRRPVQQQSDGHISFSPLRKHENLCDLNNGAHWLSASIIQRYNRHERKRQIAFKKTATSSSENFNKTRADCQKTSWTTSSTCTFCKLFLPRASKTECGFLRNAKKEGRH